MALTPNDIQNQKFETRFRGFDPDAVQDFLDQAAAEYNEVLLQNQQLEQSLKESQERVSYFTDLKDALNQSIIVAQDAAERVRENAQHEAETTKQDAQKQANELIKEATDRSNQILTEATDRSRQLTVETADLRDSTRVFHQKLQVLLQSQVAMVNAPEWDELLNQSIGSVANNQATSSSDAEPVAQLNAINSETQDPTEFEQTPSEADNADSEATVESTSEQTDTVDDSEPVFQYRSHSDEATAAPEEFSDQSQDGITVVFPEENK
ncbi:DivIVA domain-containing protein [Lapidilactobacillus mulanensis]|uniref:DivIVA domain-containing protein n=1 Tax=Lapidilactobacillus mulanensis TaxID=2485999 RepID=A0ABW4DQJ7_9LACO|nr:DivIVA domain-containing protein [Lapidilactobacillus mulanensis]